MRRTTSSSPGSTRQPGRRKRLISVLVETLAQVAEEHGIIKTALVLVGMLSPMEIIRSRGCMRRIFPQNSVRQKQCPADRGKPGGAA